jgi:hypothetical protein
MVETFANKCGPQVGPVPQCKMSLLPCAAIWAALPVSREENDVHYNIFKVDSEFYALYRGVQPKGCQALHKGPLDFATSAVRAKGWRMGGHFKLRCKVQHKPNTKQTFNLSPTTLQVLRRKVSGIELLGRYR